MIGQISPDTLAALAAALEHVDSGRKHSNMIQREVFDEIRTKLGECRDYRGEVVPAIDEVLRLILNFVVSRTAAESGHYAYLFDESAVESHIHEDMYNYLVGTLGARAEYEVSHVGGGRVDLRLKFDGFAIHIEMKVDSTQVRMNDKTAYLKQAATYQGNDIRIGFLVALRHKAFPKGPPPHLKSLMGHTKFDIPSDSGAATHRDCCGARESDQAVGIDCQVAAKMLCCRGCRSHSQMESVAFVGGADRCRDAAKIDRNRRSTLRALAAQRGDDPATACFVGELRAASVEFAEIWDQHDVHRMQPGFEVLRHPQVGRLTLECAVLQGRAPGQRLFLFRAAAGTPTGGRLAALAGRSEADVVTGTDEGE